MSQTNESYDLISLPGSDEFDDMKEYHDGILRNAAAAPLTPRSEVTQRANEALKSLKADGAKIARFRSVNKMRKEYGAKNITGVVSILKLVATILEASLFRTRFIGDVFVDDYFIRQPDSPSIAAPPAPEWFKQIVSYRIENVFCYKKFSIFVSHQFWWICPYVASPHHGYFWIKGTAYQQTQSALRHFPIAMGADTVKPRAPLVTSRNLFQAYDDRDCTHDYDDGQPYIHGRRRRCKPPKTHFVRVGPDAANVIIPESTIVDSVRRAFGLLNLTCAYIMQREVTRRILNHLMPGWAHKLTTQVDGIIVYLYSRDDATIGIMFSEQGMTYKIDTHTTYEFLLQGYEGCERATISEPSPRWVVTVHIDLLSLMEHVIGVNIPSGFIKQVAKMTMYCRDIHPAIIEAHKRGLNLNSLPLFCDELLPNTVATILVAANRSDIAFAMPVHCLLGMKMEHKLGECFPHMCDTCASLLYIPASTTVCMTVGATLVTNWSAAVLPELRKHVGFADSEICVQRHAYLHRYLIPDIVNLVSSYLEKQTTVACRTCL